MQDIRCGACHRKLGAGEYVRLVPPGAVVCDPFAGSGTFLVAAQEAGHQWIGCELEHAYHELALRRLAASRATSQDAAPLSDAEQT